VRKLLGFVVGLLSLAALARLLVRRRRQVDPVTPLEPTREDETAPMSDDSPDDTIGERRANVHAHARDAIDAMRGRTGADDA
jgi:hypothetical protein